MISEFIMDVVVQTVLITFFVLDMIMLLECFNVYTQGVLNRFMHQHSSFQILVSTILGLLPGCLGSYTAVSLYTHDVIGLGSLVSNLIATTGDEALMMVAMMPQKSLLIFGILFVLALATGYTVNALCKRSASLLGQNGHFVLHPSHDVHRHRSFFTSIKDTFDNMTFHRLVLLLSVITFIVLTFMGFLDEHHDHGTEHHDNEGMGSVTITFLIFSTVSLVVLLLVSNHFLEEHIWHHVIGKHFLKVCLWTFVTLVVIFVINNVVNIRTWVESFSSDKVYFFCLCAAILVGLIPASGPHLVFITLYCSGVMPFGALVANCIVQDGHGAIPLFAESKRDFFVVKGIKTALAIIVGLVFWICY